MMVRAPYPSSGSLPDDGAPPLREYLAVIWRRKLTVLVIFVLTTAAAVMGAYLTPAEFTADTSLLVRLGREFLYRPEVGGVEGSKALSLEEMVNSQVEILRSRDLALETVRQLGVEVLYPSILEKTRDPQAALARGVVAFQGHLVVASVPESGIIKISFSHLKPAVAADALNTLVEKFKEKHLELFSDSNSEFLREQVELYQSDLAEAEAALQTFKQEHGIIEMAEQKASIVKQHAELETELRTARFRIKELEEQLAAFRATEGESAALELGGLMPNEALSRQRAALISARSDVDVALQEVEARIAELTGSLARFEERRSTAEGGAPPQPGVEQFRSLEEARIRLLDLQLRYLELRHKYNKESREASALEREMRLVEGFLRRRGTYVEKVLEAGISDELSALRARRQALAAQTERLSEELRSLADTERSLQTRVIETELAALRFKRDALAAEIADLKQEIASTSAREKTLQELERRVTINEQHLQTYLVKYEQARTEEKLDEQKIVNIRVFEKAVPPVSAAGLSRKVKVVLGAAAGLLAGIAAAFFLELVKR